MTRTMVNYGRKHILKIFCCRCLSWPHGWRACAIATQLHIEHSTLTVDQEDLITCLWLYYYYNLQILNADKPVILNQIIVLFSLLKTFISWIAFRKQIIFYFTIYWSILRNTWRRVFTLHHNVLLMISSKNFAAPLSTPLLFCFLIYFYSNF